MESQVKYIRPNTTSYRTIQHNDKGILQNCLIEEKRGVRKIIKYHKIARILYDKLLFKLNILHFWLF